MWYTCLQEYHLGSQLFPLLHKLSKNMFFCNFIYKKTPTGTCAIHFVFSKILSRPGKKYLFPYKLCKISLQQGRFPQVLEGLPYVFLNIFPSKSQNFPARSFPFLPVFFQGLVLVQKYYPRLYTYVQISVCTQTMYFHAQTDTACAIQMLHILWTC